MSNEVKLSGKLCNPRFKTTASGVDIFEGAITVSRKDQKTNQWITGFMPIVAFKNVALELKAVEPKAMIELTKAKISIDVYKDKNGDDKQKMQVMVFEFVVLQKPGVGVADKLAVQDIKAYDLSKQIESADDIPF